MSTRHPDLIWIFAVLALAEPVAWGIQGTTPSDLTLVALNPKLTKAVTANDSTPGTTDGFITPGGDNGAPDPTWTDDRLPGTEMRLFVTEDFGSEVTGRYKLSGGRCGQISPTNTASVECPIEVVASFVPYCGTAPVSSSTPCDQASRFDIHFRIRQAPGITIPGQPPLKTIQTWSAGGIQGIAPTRLTLQQILDAAPLASPSPGASAAPALTLEALRCENEKLRVEMNGGTTQNCSPNVTVVKLAGNQHNASECIAAGGTLVSTDNLANLAASEASSVARNKRMFCGFQRADVPSSEFHLPLRSKVPNLELTQFCPDGWLSYKRYMYSHLQRSVSTRHNSANFMTGNWVPVPFRDQTLIKYGVGSCPNGSRDADNGPSSPVNIGFPAPGAWMRAPVFPVPSGSELNGSGTFAARVDYRSYIHCEVWISSVEWEIAPFNQVGCY